MSMPPSKRVFRYQYVAWTNVTMKKALEIRVFVGYRTHVNVNIWQMKSQPGRPVPIIAARIARTISLLHVKSSSFVP